jgi:hypothetical protein
MASFISKPVTSYVRDERAPAFSILGDRRTVAGLRGIIAAISSARLGDIPPGRGDRFGGVLSAAIRMMNAITIANRWCRWNYLSGFNKWKSRPLYEG